MRSESEQNACKICQSADINLRCVDFIWIVSHLSGFVGLKQVLISFQAFPFDMFYYVLQIVKCIVGVSNSSYRNWQME